VVRKRIPERVALRGLALIASAFLYVAAHWLITWGVSLHEQHLLRDAPRHADAVIAAVLQLRSVAQPGGTPMTAQERAALDAIDQGMRRLDHAAPPSGYRIASPTDLWSLEDWRTFRSTGVVPPQEAEDHPCAGRTRAANPEGLPPLPENVDPLCDLAFTVDHLSGLPADITHEQHRIASDVTRKFRAFLKCAAIAVPFSAAWLVLTRRRRHRNAEVVADVVRMARAFTPARPLWYRWLHTTLTGLGYALLVAGLALAKTGSLILGYSRPRARVDPIRTLAHGGRAPVLYLRSFADDREAAHQGDIPLGGLMRFAEIESREELFATVLGAFGPLVAVGRPDERLPPLGAVRLYFPSDTWRSAVAQLMDQSRLVVIRLGEGQQLWWEFDHAVRHLPPGKVLALLPGRPLLPPSLIDRLDASLPEPSGAAEAVRLSGNGWTSAVLSFDTSWRAQVFPVGPLPGKKSHLSPAHEVARSLQLALAATGVRRRGLGLRMNAARVAILGKAALVLPLLALLAHMGWLITELRR
jgi:hypothetical protein